MNAELAEAKKILAENQPLVSSGDQLYKLNPINKQPSSLDADIFYAMAQAVIPKASHKSICFGGGFIVGGLLASLGINDNKIISGIPNLIPSPSNLQCVVKKYREDTFMSIAWFVCNYSCSISCGKVYHFGLVHMVKEISFWGG